MNKARCMKKELNLIRLTENEMKNVAGGDIGDIKVFDWGIYPFSFLVDDVAKLFKELLPCGNLTAGI